MHINRVLFPTKYEKPHFSNFGTLAIPPKNHIFGKKWLCHILSTIKAKFQKDLMAGFQEKTNRQDRQKKPRHTVTQIIRYITIDITMLYR